MWIEHLPNGNVRLAIQDNSPPLPIPAVLDVELSSAGVAALIRELMHSRHM